MLDKLVLYASYGGAIVQTNHRVMDRLQTRYQRNSLAEKLLERNHGAFHRVIVIMD